jgi:hypothetical protein
MKRFYECKRRRGRLLKRNEERKRREGEPKKRKDNIKQEPRGESGEREAEVEV